MELKLGVDYILLPKPVWEVMVDWYGGGPVFCRRAVRVSPRDLEISMRGKNTSRDKDAMESSRR